MKAVRDTFDQDYPVADFRNLRTSIEFPVTPQDYPGIWVDYEDSGSVRIAGIGHAEFSDPAEDGSRRRFTRWRFQGTAQFTVVALSSLERDRLYDEMVRVLAFGNYNVDAPQINAFRQTIENNEFIAMNFDFDEVEPSGNSASPGTPWGTDEIIYERTINMELVGEFVSDGLTQEVVNLSQVIFYLKQTDPEGNYTDDHPAYPGSPDNNPDDPNSWQ